MLDVKVRWQKVRGKWQVRAEGDVNATAIVCPIGDMNATERNRKGGNFEAWLKTKTLAQIADLKSRGKLWAIFEAEEAGEPQPEPVTVIDAGPQTIGSVETGPLLSGQLLSKCD